jgi:murein L,D-transpeptidase YcbB/YkuD
MDRIILKAIGLAALATMICSRDVGAPPCGADCVPQGEISSAIRDSIASNLPWLADSRRLYEKVAYQPLWIVDSRPSRQAMQVLDYLAGIQARGLRPADYGVHELQSFVTTLDSGAASAALLARIDLSMSRALFRALSDLHQGRVDPAALGIDLPRAGGLDLQAVMVDVSRAERVVPVIESVEPMYPGYASLIRALSRYRDLAADSVLRAPPDPRRVVRPGESYDGVHDLIRLLAALGDFVDTAVPAPGVDRFDGSIVDAVRAFQRRHGLEPDGVLGRATMAELRVPMAKRIWQIELALERWRWLPHEPPDRYIMVNLPEFRLRAFDRLRDAQSAALTLNVIVGRSRGQRTPVFTATMREVVFHPYWDVPLSIARNELVPIIRRTPKYFTDGDFEIVRGPGENARQYPLTAENLARVAGGTLRLRQRPGPGNALGLVKLVFPNPYRVFLHDTPGRGLFTSTRRDFSHGCIRVERPVTLATFVLSREPGWDSLALQLALGGSRTQHVNVTRPLTVFVQYVTASVDEAGVLHFHPDLYRHDDALTTALTPDPD